MTDRAEKKKGLCWSHCLLISIGCHVCLAALVIFFFPETEHLQDYARDARTYDLVHPVRFASVETLSESGTEKAEPESLSPEADPFESEESGAVAEPSIELSHHSFETESVGAQVAEIRQNTGEEVVKEVPDEGGTGLEAAVAESASGVADSSGEKIGEEDRGSQGTVEENDDGAMTQGTGKKLGTEKAAVDMNRIWQSYTKTLSAHFKSNLGYPEMAKRLRLTGTVWVLMEIRRDGTMISAEIDESSGVEMLDEAALDSARSAFPVPPFPEETTEQSKKVRIPYRYKLR